MAGVAGVPVPPLLMTKPRNIVQCLLKNWHCIFQYVLLIFIRTLHNGAVQIIKSSTKVYCVMQMVRHFNWLQTFRLIFT